MLKHDRFADLRLRYLIGPSVGYKVAKGPLLNLRVEIGATYLDEDFYDQPDTEAWGPALFIDYDQYLLNKRLQLYQRNMAFASVEGTQTNHWRSWTGLRVPLVAGFVGSLEFEIDYDSDPAVDTKTTDTTLRAKVGYQW